MNNNNNNNNSKEETGRDTPQLYSAIVGGEGQDFVATTLSTSAQVRRERQRGPFFFFSSDTTLLLLFNLFLQFPIFYICFSFFYAMRKRLRALNSSLTGGFRRCLFFYSRTGRSGGAKSPILVRVEKCLRVRTIPGPVGSVGDFATAGV